MSRGVQIIREYLGDIDTEALLHNLKIINLRHNSINYLRKALSAGFAVKAERCYNELCPKIFNLGFPDGACWPRQGTGAARTRKAELGVWFCPSSCGMLMDAK